MIILHLLGCRENQANVPDNFEDSTGTVRWSEANGIRLPPDSDGS